MTDGPVAPNPIADDPVTFGDKNVETTQFERYRGVKGRTDRVALLSSKLQRSFSYFVTGTGRFRVPKDDDLRKMLRDQLGEPLQRFGLTLFHYLTDDAGALIDTEKLKGRVKLWLISEARYEELSGIHRNWPLLDQGFSEKQMDLQIVCSEEKFQRMTFTPFPEAQWKKKEAWYKALHKRELQAQEKVKVALGREFGRQEILDVLGASTAPTQGTADNAGDIDLSDVADDL